MEAAWSVGQGISVTIDPTRTLNRSRMYPKVGNICTVRGLPKLSSKIQGSSHVASFSLFRCIDVPVTFRCASAGPCFRYCRRLEGRQSRDQGGHVRQSRASIRRRHRNLCVNPWGPFFRHGFSVNSTAPAAANATEAERAALFTSIVAYNGVYRIEGDKLRLMIDNSHIQSWNGTERPITFDISGTRLTGRTAPYKAATTGLDVFAEVIWEKLE